jgi:16S rRNA (guanine527-N7)-methyltransferase
MAPILISSSPESQNLLQAGVEELGLSLTSDIFFKFLLYLEELQKWNKQINLTALKKTSEIIRKHFLDSLALYTWIKDFDNLLDLGTGAGFPGLPLKLVLPALDLTLIESTGKKVAFLGYLIARLEISGVKVNQCYMTPKLAQSRGPCFQAIVSRAAFPLSQFMTLAAPMLLPGGLLLAMKSVRLSEEEWQEAVNCAPGAGLQAPQRHPYLLPLTGEPQLLIVLRRI